jgi:hypothetical protein
MSVSLNEFVKNVAGFNSWSHADKIRFFAWFVHHHKGQDRFSSSDIKGCYDLLHLEKPNISQFLSEMERRRPKEAIKDSRGYYLAGHLREGFEKKYGQPTVETNPKTEQVIPKSVVANTRGYYERIIQQANGCYERQWFDACSVMIRKFVEILIIEVYEANRKANEIKDSSGDFFMLRDLITVMLKDLTWNLGRETKKSLPEIKLMGDRSAHTRRYLAMKGDVDKVIPGLRVIADELLHLAKLK